MQSSEASRLLDVFGGSTGSRALKDLWAFNFYKNTWTEVLVGFSLILLEWVSFYFVGCSLWKVFISCVSERSERIRSYPTRTNPLITL